MPWATTDDVSLITGATVTDGDLARAQSVIEVFVGRTESETSTSRMTTAALGWLRKAVAYQAAWMKARPDLFEQVSVKRTSADGQTIEFTGDGQLLAPFAKRALKRLGWKGTRSIYAPSTLASARVRLYPASEGVVGVHDFPDDPWHPL